MYLFIYLFVLVVLLWEYCGGWIKLERNGGWKISYYLVVIVGVEIRELVWGRIDRIWWFVDEVDVDIMKRCKEYGKRKRFGKESNYFDVFKVKYNVLGNW